MARITIRLDDDVYDRLLQRAAYVGMPCTTMIRPLLERLAYPAQGVALNRSPKDEALAAVLQILELLHADLERRAPDALKAGIDRSRSILRDRNLLEDADGR